MAGVAAGVARRGTGIRSTTMTARGRALRSAGAMALLAAAAVGCGGSSADETRAQVRRWTSAVDEVCRTTRERIVTRGGAEDASGLESMAARARDDVGAAIERIRRVPISETARSRVRPFLAELTKIEPWLSQMTRTTADGSLKEIGDLGLRLADRTKLFQDRAEAVGLRECADPRQFDAVLDAFTAPVYATQIARFEVWFARGLRPWVTYVPATSTDFVRQLRRVNRTVSRAEDRLDDLYRYRPNRAVEADRDLGFALDAYEELFEVVAESLDGGRRVLTPVGARRFRRAVVKRQREIRRAIARLRTAIGAEPLPVPGARPVVEPEKDSA
jgi:hypothetical protein